MDSSFNLGGDTIVLPGLANSYTAYRSGAEVIFARNDGAVTLRIPIGSSGTEIQFDGGDSRTLLFSSSAGGATLEGQLIGTSSTSPTAITGSNIAPASGYDVVNTVSSASEGNGGTTELTFTITLDRAVSAADGPITFAYQTQNATASSDSDYAASAGFVTFGVGQQVATVRVNVIGDTTVESDENVYLFLSGDRLGFGSETLVGRILNDDSTGNVTTLNEGASYDLSGSTQVQTVDIVNSTSTNGQTTTITLDAQTGQSTGSVTINGTSLTVNDALVIVGGAAAANITVNGGEGADTIRTGSGADTVNGNVGADSIRLGGGADTGNGGDNNDNIRGELGNDTLNGDAKNDFLFGDFAFSDGGGTLAGYIALGGGDDTLNGGSGGDTLVGGLGRDTLTGGSEADNFRFQAVDDSRLVSGGADNRDRITDFNSAEGDKIDLTTLFEATGQTIRFGGNFATLAEAQSAASGSTGGSFLDVFYVQESDTLFVDVNNDGVLNGDDLQIILQDAAPSFTLNGADVNAGVVVGSPPVVASSGDFDMIAVDQRSTRFDNFEPMFIG